MSGDPRGRALPNPPPWNATTPSPAKEVESRTAIYVGSFQATSEPNTDDPDDQEETAIAHRHQVLGSFGASEPDAPLPERTAIMQNTDMANAMRWNPMPQAPVPEPAPTPHRQPRARMGSVQWPVPSAATEPYPQYPQQPRARMPSYHEANPAQVMPPAQPRARMPSYHEANPAQAMPPAQPRARMPSYHEANPAQAMPPAQARARMPSYHEANPAQAMPPAQPRGRMPSYHEANPAQALAQAAPASPAIPSDAVKPQRTPPMDIDVGERSETNRAWPRILTGYLSVCAVLAVLGLLLLGWLKLNDYF